MEFRIAIQIAQFASNPLKKGQRCISEFLGKVRGFLRKHNNCSILENRQVIHHNRNSGNLDHITEFHKNQVIGYLDEVCWWEEDQPYRRFRGTVAWIYIWMLWTDWTISSFITSVKLSPQCCTIPSPFNFASYRKILPQIAERPGSLRELIFQRKLAFVELSKQRKFLVYQKEFEKKLLWYLEKLWNDWKIWLFISSFTLSPQPCDGRRTLHFVTR
jgi:hypothetical protein